MWNCKHCSEELEDSFDTCWSCGTDREGTRDPSFQDADDLPPPELPCPCCGATGLQTVGYGTYFCSSCGYDSGFDDPVEAYNAPDSHPCPRCLRDMCRGFYVVDSDGQDKICVFVADPDDIREENEHTGALKYRAFRCGCGVIGRWTAGGLGDTTYRPPR